MQSKRLVSSTIIPPALYVTREADRQLASNLSTMGRPAYILVARQMGKTNLLLNAKRTLETNDDRFVYVDLSTNFQEERECFRSIIDIALDSHGSLLEPVRATILAARDESRPPNKEHDFELRTILDRIPGKLVVILDEIDSLTNAPFSDRIFAQIRSIYFSRANYQCLEKLTYILSGVVEPNEIIKDRKISPFNIGEKIYLDDFNVEESNQFFDLAGLKFEAPVLERIIFWAGGHPRIMWDTCARLEDEYLSGSRVAVSDVDRVVRELYLTDFDRAPIDHIRQLVNDSPEICAAVSDIATGTAQSISDKMSTRLYLNGIIRGSVLKDGVVFKNRIIAESLSIDWLKDILNEQTDKFAIAQRKFDKRLYEDAFDLYHEAYSSGLLRPSLEEIALFEMGRCLYYQQKYVDAVGYLRRTNDNVDEASPLRPSALLLEGTCLVSLKEFDAAIACLCKIIELPYRDRTFLEAKLNIAAAHLARGEPDDFAAVTAMLAAFDDVAAGVPDKALQTSDRNELRAIARFNLAKAHVALAQSDHALTALYESLSICRAGSRPAVQLQIVSVISEVNAKKDVVRAIVHDIVNSNLKASEFDPSNPLSFRQDLAMQVIQNVFELELHELEDPILRHCELHYSKAHTPRYTLLLRGGQDLYVAELSECAERMLLAATRCCDSKEGLRSCYLWLFLVSNWKRYAEDYTALFLDNEPPSGINALDLTALRNAIGLLIHSGQLNRAESLIQVAQSYRDLVEPSLSRGFIGIDFLEMAMFERVGKVRLAAAKADEILCRAKALRDLTDDVDSVLGVETYQAILTHATSIKELFGIGIEDSGITITLPKKSLESGRNTMITVRYKDGRIVKAKFKKVERDIQAGRCSPMPGGNLG